MNMSVFEIVYFVLIFIYMINYTLKSLNLAGSQVFLQPLDFLSSMMFASRDALVGNRTQGFFSCLQF